MGVQTLSAQTDVTSQYLVNAGFEGGSTQLTTGSNNGMWQPEGWSLTYSNPDKTWDQSNLTNTELKATEGEKYFYVRIRWGATTSVKLEQKIKNLPAGMYTLTASVHCPDKNTAKITFGNASHTMAQTTGWQEVSLSYYASANQDVDLNVVVSRTSADQQRLYIDNVRLTQFLSTDISSEHPFDMTAYGVAAPWSGNSASYTAGSVKMVERYNSQFWTGAVMSKTITGLLDGKYDFEFYAEASATGRSWESSVITEADGATDYTVATVKGITVGIPIANNQTAVSSCRSYKLEDLVVKDGTISLSIENKKLGANWIIAEVKSLIYKGPDLAIYEEAFDSYYESLAALSLGDVPEPLAEKINSAKTTYASRPTSLSELEAANAQMSSLIKAYNEQTVGFVRVKNLISTCEDIIENSVTETADVKSTFASAVSQALADANAAESSAVLQEVYNTLEGKRQDYVKVAYPLSGYSFDMTFMMSDAAVTNASAWTNGRLGSGEEYTGAPDNTYLDIWNSTTDMYRTVTNLPEGVYSITAATRASADIADSYIYAQGDGEKIAATTHQVGNTGNTLDRGWDWTTINNVVVAKGNLVIGFYANAVNYKWAGADDFRLTRSYDVASVQAALLSLKQAAQAVNVLPMGIAESAALTAAINAAEEKAESTNPFELRATIVGLEEAMKNAESWLTAYNEAKAPLVAALERFETEYNNGANGALQAMSTEAWNALLTKVQAAAEAKDATTDYSGFAVAATNLTEQFTKTDASIKLYTSYSKVINVLEEYDDATLAEVLITVKSDAYKATDAKLEEAMGLMNSAFVKYASSQEGSFDMNSFLGENLGFESTQIEQDLTYTNVYVQPSWNNLSDINATGVNTGYVFRTNTFENLSGVTPIGNNVLYMRSKWGANKATLQITKRTTLPQGNYILSFWMKKSIGGGDTDLNYLEVNGERMMFEANSAWEQKTVTFAVDEMSYVELSFGFIGGQGGTESYVYVDDVNLVYELKSAYEKALESAQGMTNSLAVQSAMEQFGDKEAILSGPKEQRTLATNVLNKAMTMAENGDAATSLWSNADFKGGTISHVQGSNGKVNSPSGWDFAYTFEGWNDTYVMDDDVFNVWAGTIRYAELKQTVGNIPNGTYKLSAYLDSDGDTQEGNSWVALYGAPKNGDVVRSCNVAGDTSTEYTAYVKVVDNELTVGVRTDARYFKIKNLSIQFVEDNAAETDKGRMYQHAFLRKDALEVDFTSFAAAQGVKVYMTQPNVIMTANEGQLTNEKNVVVNGVCEQLVLTDKSPLNISNEFEATSATYTRAMSNDWGTVILPYAVTSNEEVKYYELTEVSTGASDVMTFTLVDVLEASKPGAFKKQTGAAEVALSANNAAVAVTNDTEGVCAVDGWTMTGSYTAQTIDVTQDASYAYYYISNNQFWHATGSLTLNPFRACFKSLSASEVKNFMISLDDNQLTGIDDAHATANSLVVFGERGRLVMEAGCDVNYAVYTLSGQLVEQGALRQGESRSVAVAAGVYVVNGAKVQVK